MTTRILRFIRFKPVNPESSREKWNDPDHLCLVAEFDAGEFGIPFGWLEKAKQELNAIHNYNLMNDRRGRRDD